MSTTRYPLGRHVQHDPRSLAYQVPPQKGIKSVRWTRRAPVFDQGDLGSCCGNAGIGAMGTDCATAKGDRALREKDALDLYEMATRLDDVPGFYPPDDTGSSGLAVAKALLNLGEIKSYQHCTTTDQMTTALQTGPVIVGTNWHGGMDAPDSTGYVRPKGPVRGGHEYLCLGVDLLRGLYEFCNSWGTSWGVKGHFFMSISDFALLLKEQGDVTVLNR